jgi:hypothetical protein
MYAAVYLCSFALSSQRSEVSEGTYEAARPQGRALSRDPRPTYHNYFGNSINDYVRETPPRRLWGFVATGGR